MAQDAPDPAAFYQYMFKPDNTPTDTLEALLRAIANHIIAEIGDKNERHLTPTKLAAFYRAVGGNYDRLLLDMCDSISFIWSTIGCQHSLQPTDDDFAPPCIPALTPRGFVRWQSVELLLAPALHVPYLQNAVANWNLRHPDTGVPFPSPLPCEAFPTEPNEKLVTWHEQQLETLKPEEAHHAEEEDHRKAPNTSEPSFTREPRHSPRRPRPPRVETDSSDDEAIRGRRKERQRGPGNPASGVNYVQPPRPGPTGAGGPRRPSGGLFPTVTEEESARRRSVSDHPSPLERRRSPSFNRERPTQWRRYSQPRADDIVSSDTESPSPRSRPKGRYGSDPALRRSPPPPQLRSSVRHVQPGFASPSRGYSPGLRPDARSDDRRKSFPFGVLGDKLQSIIKGPERQRSTSRTNSHTSSSYTRGGGGGGGDNYRDVPPHVRVVESDDTDDYNSSERARRLRARERDRDRDRDRTAKPAPPRARERGVDRDRDVFRDQDRERMRPKERQPEVYEDPLRPYPRRGSPYHRGSPVEVDRRRKPDWVDIDPERERERERFRPERRRRDAPVYRD